MKSAHGLQRLVVGVATALSLSACDTPAWRAEFDAAHRIKADPALLPVEVQPAEVKLPFALILVAPADLSDAVTPLPLVPGSWAKKQSDPAALTWKLEIGSIVELALKQSLNAVLTGSLLIVPSTPAPGSGQSGSLVLRALQFDYDEQLRYSVPLGLSSWTVFEARTRLVVELDLSDAHGQPAWRHTYDDGWHSAVYRSDGFDEKGEGRWQTGVQRSAHEAAARVAQRALQDLRSWQAEQQTKPRRL